MRTTSELMLGQLRKTKCKLSTALMLAIFRFLIAGKTTELGERDFKPGPFTTRDFNAIFLLPSQATKDFWKTAKLLSLLGLLLRQSFQLWME